MNALPVVLLPGIVLPAELAYGDLITALGKDVQTIVKDLDIYRDDAPPADYSLDTEVAGVLREADARGWSRFHLVGYSAGGAAALAFAARQPARLLSLALLEPAWAGDWDWSAEHRRLWAKYDELDQVSAEQYLPAFMKLQVRPEVQLPPPPAGPPPPWMSKTQADVMNHNKANAAWPTSRGATVAAGRPRRRRRARRPRCR